MSSHRRCPGPLPPKVPPSCSWSWRTSTSPCGGRRVRAHRPARPARRRPWPGPRPGPADRHLRAV